MDSFFISNVIIIDVYESEEGGGGVEANNCNELKKVSSIRATSKTAVQSRAQYILSKVQK